MRCVLDRYDKTSTASVYSLTCNAASNKRNNLRSSGVKRMGMYFARSTKSVVDGAAPSALASSLASSISSSPVPSSLLLSSSRPDVTASRVPSRANSSSIALAVESASRLAFANAAAVFANPRATSSNASPSPDFNRSHASTAPTNPSLDISSHSRARARQYSANCVRETRNLATTSRRSSSSAGASAASASSPLSLSRASSTSSSSSRSSAAASAAFVMSTRAPRARVTRRHLDVDGQRLAQQLDWFLQQQRQS